jgi:hypothetical protein
MEMVAVAICVVGGLLLETKQAAGEHERFRAYLFTGQSLLLRETLRDAVHSPLQTTQQGKTSVQRGRSVADKQPENQKKSSLFSEGCC